MVADLRKLKALEGRVVLHGEEEAGREAGRIYLLLEGTDGRLQHVYYTPEIHYARSLGKLRRNSFIRLRRMFTEDGRPGIEVQDLGDSEKLLNNRHHFTNDARRLIRRGVMPTENGWNGWLGRYQSALVYAADEIRRNLDTEVRIEPDRGSHGRR